jgi:hypothetical protein
MKNLQTFTDFINEGKFRENDLVELKKGDGSTMVVVSQKGRMITVENDDEETVVYKESELKKVR